MLESALTHFAALLKLCPMVRSWDLLMLLMNLSVAVLGFFLGQLNISCSEETLYRVLDYFSWYKFLAVTGLKCAS
jgi:hypothetical protein